MDFLFRTDILLAIEIERTQRFVLPLPVTLARLMNSDAVLFQLWLDSLAYDASKLTDYIFGFGVWCLDVLYHCYETAHRVS